MNTLNDISICITELAHQKPSEEDKEKTSKVTLSSASDKGHPSADSDQTYSKKSNYGDKSQQKQKDEKLRSKSREEKRDVAQKVETLKL